jgi:serine/threonine-protein kinase
MAPATPEMIGKYEVRRQIGRGAMGVVYEGFDPVIERRVAIKTLRVELFEPSQLANVGARFKREAQSAGRLSHPHIVTIHDYGEHQGTPYIVMEFMSGEELSRHLSRGTRLPLAEIVRLMSQLLGALSYAHEHKVIHRDIKPSNIFILEDGSLKVVDFSIARIEASELTDTGALLGTPAYMSPEQFLALPVDERSDIFSAGVILYELLTGDKPFTGSVTTIMQKVLHQEPIEPSVLNPMLSPAWNAVTRRAMAKKPEARFASARQFAETIKQVNAARTLDVSAEVTAPGTASSAGQSGAISPPDAGAARASRSLKPEPSAAARPEPARAKRYFWRRGLVLVAAVGALAAGVGVFYAWRPAADERVTPGPRLMVAEAERKAAAKPSAEPSAAAGKAQAEQRAVLAMEPRAAEPSERAAAKTPSRTEVAAAAPAELAREPRTRAERERARDEELARKALAEARKGQEVQVAAAPPTAVAPGAAAPTAAAPAAAAVVPKAIPEHEALYEKARDLENSDAKAAVRLYRQAARKGSGKAAKRLGEIFDKGLAGISRDYQESLQWYELARRLGEDVETAGRAR